MCSFQMYVAAAHAAAGRLVSRKDRVEQSKYRPQPPYQITTAPRLYRFADRNECRRRLVRYAPIANVARAEIGLPMRFTTTDARDAPG